MRVIKFFVIMSIALWVSTLALSLTYTQTYKKLKDLSPMGSVSENPNAPYSAIIQIIENDQFICSGVVFDSKYALTAGHCLDGDNFTIKDSNGVDTHTTAITAGRESRVDFGMIMGDFTKFRFLPAEFYKEGFLSPGPFITCGFPYGQKKLLCTPFTPLKREGFMIGGSGSLYPGMSGGPVIDVLTGKIVGVNSAVGDGLTYCTSIVGAAGFFGIEP